MASISRGFRPGVVAFPVILFRGARELLC